jgi:hypothetical protein
MYHILDHYRHRMAVDAADRVTPSVEALNVDRHLAASVMQKAIRRSERAWALAAAKRLLDLEPARFWRRLSVTLFEDVGIDDRELALSALALAPARTIRPASWPMIARLIERLCEAPKTQIANHLVHLAIHDPDELDPMASFDCLSFSQAFGWIKRDRSSLVQKCRAAWLLSGLETGRQGQPQAHPEADRGRLQSGLDAILDSIELLLILQEGVRLVRGPLPIAAVLEARFRNQEAVPAAPTWAADEMPSAGASLGVPNWAHDQHTRAGKRALNLAATQCPQIANAVASVIGLPAKRRCLSSAHFEFESAKLARRLQYAPHLAHWLRVQNIGAFRHPKLAEKLYAALKADWTAFERLRESVLTGGEHNGGNVPRSRTVNLTGL